MDGTRFDAVTRTLAAGVPRRVALSAFGGAVLSLFDHIHAGTPVESSKKGKKNKKNKKKCKPNCAGKSCGNDGCSGTCGRCDGSCVAGVCECPGTLRSCSGACRQCCNDGDCDNGRSCLQGVCACPSGRAPCPNQCCLPFETCEIGMCASPSTPECDGFSSPCATGASCCSGACVELLGILYCDRGEPGEPCFNDDDCVAGASCISFHCLT